jgi:competence ComEA-like helix-hairpin-helix protein
MNKFFYYDKTDRRLLALALGLLLVIVGLKICFPAFSWRPADDDAELSAFRHEMTAQDSLRRAGHYARYPRRPQGSRRSWSRPKPFTLASLRLQAFDPNQADSARLAAMGLPLYVVRSLTHYRQRGGVFRTAESVHRLYGMTDSLFACLQPYLQFPVEADTAASAVAVVYVPAEKYPAGTLVDLNTADTTELKKIPGIGSGIARAIVGYRERLGGFSSVEQLAEVRFVTPQMQQWFTVRQPVQRRIRVNHDRLDRLRAHPYLDYYQAKAIITERNARGEIKSLSRLSLYKEFTEKDFERLSPYVDFD